MPDNVFSLERLAEVYDDLDGDRSDLDGYVAVLTEVGARRVFDVGCGTGCLAIRLAADGIEVTGVDPAAASLRVARGKAGADRVEWIDGIATDVASDPDHRGRYDAATMSANVAQVFLTDEEWDANLRAIHDCLRPGGTVVFETRDPADRGWERWTPERSRQIVDVPGIGEVEDWHEVTDVDGEFVTFSSPTVFQRTGERLDSTSTLRFRDEPALRASLARCGFCDIEFRTLPYAPGRGWLIVARTAPTNG